MKSLKASLLVTLNLCLPNICAAADEGSICHTSGIDSRLDDAWEIIESNSQLTNRALHQHRVGLEILAEVCRAYRENTPEEYRIPEGVFSVPARTGVTRINPLSGAVEMVEQALVICHFPFDYSRVLPEGFDDSGFLFVESVRLSLRTAESAETERFSEVNIIRSLVDPEIVETLQIQAENVKRSEAVLVEALENANIVRENYRTLERLIMPLYKIRRDEHREREVLIKEADSELSTIVRSMLNEGLLNPAVITNELERLKAIEREADLALKVAIDSNDDTRINNAGNNATKASLERGEFQYEFMKLLDHDSDQVFEQGEVATSQSDLQQLELIAEYEKLSDYVTVLLDILKSIEELGDENAVSIAREHFLDAYCQKDVAELHAYPQRVKAKIRSKDQELFVAGRRMEVLRQQQETSDRNYHHKYSEFCEQYSHNTILEKYLYCEQEEARASLISSYLGEITKDQEAKLVELFRLKKLRDKISQDYSESCAHYQASQSELLKLITQYKEAFPGHRIPLTSQSIIDEEDRKRALELALMEAAKAAMLAQMEAKKAQEWAQIQNEQWKERHAEVESLSTLDSALVDLGLTTKQRNALNYLYELSKQEEELEESYSRAVILNPNLKEHAELFNRLQAVKEKHEYLRNEYFEEYLSSDEEKTRTFSKLMELEEKIQRIQRMYENIEESLGSLRLDTLSEIQKLNLGQKSFAMGFLRRLYEQHHTLLKEYLDSTGVRTVSAEESSNEASIDGGMVDDGVSAEQASVSVDEYNLTSEQRAFIDRLYELEVTEELGGALRHGFDEYYARYFDGKSLRETFGNEEQLNNRRNQYEEAYRENYDLLEEVKMASDSINAERLKKKKFVLGVLLDSLCRYRHAIYNTPDVRRLRAEEGIAWEAYQLIKKELEEIESTGDEAAISSQKEKVDVAMNEWWTTHIRIDDVVITEYKEPFVDHDSDVDEVEEAQEAQEAQEAFTTSNERVRPVETAEVRPVAAFSSSVVPTIPTRMTLSDVSTTEARKLIDRINQEVQELLDLDDDF